MAGVNIQFEVVISWLSYIAVHFGGGGKCLLKIFEDGSSGMSKNENEVNDRRHDA
jgi:hypothetical protein